MNLNKRIVFVVGVAVLLIASSAGLGGCREGGMHRAGSKTRDALDKGVDKVKDGANAVKDGGEDFIEGLKKK